MILDPVVNLKSPARYSGMGPANETETELILGQIKIPFTILENYLSESCLTEAIAY